MLGLGATPLGWIAARGHHGGMAWSGALPPGPEDPRWRDGRRDWIWHAAQQRWLYAPQPRLSDLRPASDAAVRGVTVAATVALVLLMVLVVLAF